MLTGSVAAAAYGVPVEPRDFDIAPGLEQTNLERLAGVLRRWGAKPVYIPEWKDTLTPDEIAVWQPVPKVENLDHLMETPFGRFDPVPEISGRYVELVERALPAPFEDFEVLVAHPDDLLAQLRLKTEKHRRREPQLRAARDRRPSLDRLYFKK